MPQTDTHAPSTHAGNAEADAPYVNVHFPAEGRQLPADHGYALYSAITRRLPTLHSASWLELKPSLVLLIIPRVFAGPTRHILDWHRDLLNAFRQSLISKTLSTTPKTVLNAFRQQSEEYLTSKASVKILVCVYGNVKKLLTSQNFAC